MERDERAAVAATRAATQAARGNPYGLADAVARDRERADEVESWRYEHRLIWADIRACAKCVRGTGGMDRPVWHHCLEHLGELTEHLAYRPW
jgi:hypothetical protein